MGNGSVCKMVFQWPAGCIGLIDNKSSVESYYLNKEPNEENNKEDTAKNVNATVNANTGSTTPQITLLGKVDPF